MKDRILVDTNIWIEFFRGSSSAGEHLTFLLQEHSIFTCGIILFELLQGIRSEKERNLVVETLQGL
ncbi:MAG: PIN domain-containing protein, partial [Thermodesulfovibrionales bacterium]